MGEREDGDPGCVDSVDVEGAYTDDGECGMGGILYIKLRMFMRSAYVSCIDLRRLTSSSCATTLLRLPFRLGRSVLSSPLLTRSITSLSKATLRPYAMTAAWGSSLVESS